MILCFIRGPLPNPHIPRRRSAPLGLHFSETPPKFFSAYGRVLLCYSGRGKGTRVVAGDGSRKHEAAETGREDCADEMPG